MAKFSYLWIVETHLGTWKDWVSKGRKGPQLNKDGTLTLDKKDYTVDSKKFRKWHIRNFRGEIKHTVYVQLWRQDEPTPIDFFEPQKQVGDDMTATMLRRLSRIKRLELITADTEMDPMKIILILSVIGNLAAIGFLISLLVS